MQDSEASRKPDIPEAQVIHLDAIKHPTRKKFNRQPWIVKAGIITGIGMFGVSSCSALSLNAYDRLVDRGSNRFTSNSEKNVITFMDTPEGKQFVKGIVDQAIEEAKIKSSQLITDNEKITSLLKNPALRSLIVILDDNFGLNIDTSTPSQDVPPDHQFQARVEPFDAH